MCYARAFCHESMFLQPVTQHAPDEWTVENISENVILLAHLPPFYTTETIVHGLDCPCFDHQKLSLFALDV
jgi:hypothetical protein